MRLSSATNNLGLQEDQFAIAQAISLDNTDQCKGAQSSGPSNVEHEMWNDFVPTDSAFEIERGPEEILQDARMEFEHKVKDFGYWGGLETLPEEDMSRIEDVWDEAEHDDILTQILQNIGQ
jgi:hypothetical protein